MDKCMVAVLRLCPYIFMLEKSIIDRKAKTGKYPKAIVPVALYGMPYDCERIMAIADKYGIPVVEANEAFIGC